MKVAIIIPTMNRPDFLLRQLRFYELMNSPHPVYIQDSSNEGNAEKITSGIKQFKNFEITYQWVLPGRDYLYQLLPLIKEKNCTQIGDDDIIIPGTLSECGDFLDSHPDYGVCMGRQVNIRFRPEDFNKPYGIIERRTRPLGRSIEDEDMSARLQNFWSKTFFIPFTVRRIETERLIRDIDKNFSLIGYLMEFTLLTLLITSGKIKLLDKLGYIMHISDRRYNFDKKEVATYLGPSPRMSEQWEKCEEELIKAICEKGVSEEESFKIVKLAAAHYLANQLQLDTGYLPSKRSETAGMRLLKRIKHFISRSDFIRSFYYKFKPPIYVDRPESKYFEDFKIVKDFLEKNQISA